MKFSFEIDNSDKTKLEFANKINEYDFKINSNYNFFIRSGQNEKFKYRRTRSSNI